jgi:hypothetical protein
MLKILVLSLRNRKNLMWKQTGFQLKFASPEYSTVSVDTTLFRRPFPKLYQQTLLIHIAQN